MSKQQENLSFTLARRCRHLRAIAAGCILAACAVETESGEAPLGTNAAPVLNGTALAEANSGMVRLPGCTGTLLRNKWVLTAVHCVNLHLDRDFPAAPYGTFAGTRDGVFITTAIVDPSGRLLLGGTLKSSSLPGDRFYLTRFTSAGALDTSFGIGGEVITDFIFSTKENVADMALQADGRIVAAGFVTFGGARLIGLARYTANGLADWSFGVAGQVQSNIPNSIGEGAHAVVIDSSQRVVVAGDADSGTVNQSRFVVARYTTAGNLDTTFNSTGFSVTDPGPGRNGYANDLVIDSATNKIVAAGFSFTSTGTTGAAALRYNATGGLDTTFDTDGKVLIANSVVANSVLIQGNQILVGGQNKLSSSFSPTVWRLNSNGASDTTFGTSGSAIPGFPDQAQASVVALALASDGRIRVAASVSTSSGVLLGYTTLSSSGGLTADRVIPTAQGTLIGTGQPAPSVMAPSAMAVFGTRVFVAGTLNPNTTTSRSAFAVLQPDRTSDTTFGGALTASMDTDQNVPADQAYYSTSNDDTALLHLSTGILMNNSRTGYQFAGFFANFGSLLNTSVICKGYGASIINPDGSFGGYDTLRSGTSLVSEVSDPYIGITALPSPATPQYTMSGDSGGNCSSGNLIVGVTSRGGSNGGALVRASRFSTWANQQILNP